MESVEIIGAEIISGEMGEIAGEIEGLVRKRKACYICLANVHTLVTGRRDPGYGRIAGQAAMALADGMPLVWVGKLKGYKNISRCAGADLMELLFNISQEKGYSHYFYGGSREALDALKKNLKQKYPNLIIKGMHSPPYRPLTCEEDEHDTARINRLSPDFIWVGLGAPRQEIWMAGHVGRIKSSVMLGVGAAINFHAGTVRRAPPIMQKLGLEWLYRLVQEPGRLWKRYLTTICLFIFYLMSDFIKELLLKATGGKK